MKRLLTFLLALGLIIGLVPAAYANDKIDILQDKKIVVGRGGGDLQLEETLTRAEFMKLLVHASKAEDLANAVQIDKESFSDVSRSHWAFKYIEFMKQCGVAKGFPNGSFKPEGSISYQEAI